jgi:hypothetical protein
MPNEIGKYQLWLDRPVYFELGNRDLFQDGPAVPTLASIKMQVNFILTEQATFEYRFNLLLLHYYAD